MKCVFKDATLLKKIISALSKDLDLVNFVFDENGLKINSMNDSHTDMRDFYLHKTFFAEYECVSHETLGVNVTLLKKFINTAGAKDVVSWKTSETTLVVSVQDLSTLGTITDWTLRLVDFEHETLIIPDDVEWDVHVRVGTVLFRQWISKSKLIDGHFTLEIIKGNVINIRVLSDLMDMKISQPVPSVMAQIVKSKPDFVSMEKSVSSKEIECLDMLIQCAPGVDIMYEKDMAVCCTSYLDTESYVRLWIAPMLTEDD
jgi:hypothetical protein